MNNAITQGAGKMECLEGLTGEIRRLACYRTDGKLKVVINASEHVFDGRTPLCQAIAVAAKDWLEDEGDRKIPAGELVELDSWLREPRARLNVEFKDGRFVAELWQDDKLMTSASINDLEIVLATIESLAHKLLIWKSPE